jgi:amphi-Trp domain-containing protein
MTAGAPSVHCGTHPQNPRKDRLMPDMEIKRTVMLSREEAGQRLIALGKALTEGPKSHVDFDGDSIRFVVSDQLEWEFELEVDGDQTELEIELKWSDAKAADDPAAARHVTATKRSRS